MHAACGGLVDKSVHIGELRAAFRKTSLRYDDALMPEMSDRAIDRLHAAADLLRQPGLRACAVGMLLQKIHDTPLRGRQMNILACNHIPLLLIEQRARPRRTHAGYPEEDATRRATAIIGEGFASPPALLRLNEVDVIFGIVSCSEQQHPAADTVDLRREAALPHHEARRCGDGKAAGVAGGASSRRKQPIGEAALPAARKRAASREQEPRYEGLPPNATLTRRATEDLSGIPAKGEQQRRPCRGPPP